MRNAEMRNDEIWQRGLEMKGKMPRLDKTTILITVIYPWLIDVS